MRVEAGGHENVADEGEVGFCVDFVVFGRRLLWWFGGVLGRVAVSESLAACVRFMTSWPDLQLIYAGGPEDGEFIEVMSREID